MQSLTWYMRRLRRMGAAEIVRRSRRAIRQPVDRLLLKWRQRRRSEARVLETGHSADEPPPFRLTDMAVGQWTLKGATADERTWREQLTRQAGRIVEHHMTLFDRDDVYLGETVDWNREYAADRATPRRFAPLIDYRDVNVTGDCKYAWEPSRHHQLVTLGRAWRACGDDRYADAVVELLDSWQDQCPFEAGMQWRSPLELGIRLINWTWTVDLIAESGRIEGDRRRRLLDSIERHVWEISRNYSYGSSANNHLVGEAAGVFVAASYFNNLRHADSRRDVAQEILRRELFRQTGRDGVSRELSVGYHLFSAQFFLLVGLVGQWSGRCFPHAYWKRLEKMFEFLSALREAGGTVPMLGDCDEGYVLDLGEKGSAGAWLAAAGALFHREEFLLSGQSPCQTARWLKRDRPPAEAMVPEAIIRPELRCRAFPDSGYYLLQWGPAGRGLSVLFDAGTLGLEPLYGHGHADALSVVLRAFGSDVLVDPGTYDYFRYPQWREYFRSTRAHNTVGVDGQNQSLAEGLFLWNAPASAHCTRWAPSGEGGFALAEHDGYRRLDDPVTHRRRVELDGPAGCVTLRDEFDASGDHEIELYFHFAEHCDVQPSDEPNRFNVTFPGGSARIELDPTLQPTLHHGSEDPIAGWISRGYHRKSPSFTLHGHCEIRGSTTLQCRMYLTPIAIPHPEGQWRSDKNRIGVKHPHGPNNHGQATTA